MNKRATAVPNDPFVEDDYEPPQSGGKYLRPAKLPEGQTRIRILAKPVKGSQGWKDNVSYYKRGKEQFAPGEVEISEKNKIKHFWAMPVWNYSVGYIQLAEVTQATIQTKLTELSRNPKWGSPLGYDVCISKKGSGIDTEYDVIPEPKEPLNEEIEETWAEAEKTFDMDRLFIGGDVFDGPPKNSSLGMRRFFAILDELVKLGVYDKSIKGKDDAAKAERRKMIAAGVGRAVEPKDMTEDDWAKACDYLGRAKPVEADDDIHF